MQPNAATVMTNSPCDKPLPPPPPQDNVYDAILCLLGCLKEQDIERDNDSTFDGLWPVHSDENELEESAGLQPWHGLITNQPDGEQLRPKTTSWHSDIPPAHEKGGYCRPNSEGLTSRERKLLLDNASNLGALFELAHRDPELWKIYKSAELPLIRKTLRKSRPEEWELREMGVAIATGPDQVLKPGSNEYFRSLACNPLEGGPTWTAADYLEHYAYEMSICAYVTGLILTGCRMGELIDTERYSALESCGSVRGKQMHRALWRVWTFCRIFGPCKGRQDDALGQQAWLAGRNPTVDLGGHRHLGGFYSEVLDLPPPSFGYGNRGGLRRFELEDMMTIWGCLKFLLGSRLSEVSSRSFHDWRIQGHDGLTNWLMSLGLDAFYHIYIQMDPLGEIQQLQWLPALNLQGKNCQPFLTRACEQRIREIEN